MQQVEVERLLASDSALAREHAALLRLRGLASASATVPVEPGLAQRLALRVRDRVHAEEHAEARVALREGGVVREGAARWSMRTRVRILLASLAVHVVVLGWLVMREHRTPISSTASPVEVAVIGPVGREPREPDEVLAPIDLGPIVAANEVPDSLLVGIGLDLDGESPAGEGHGTPHGLPAPLAGIRLAEHPEPVQFAMLARSRPGVRAQRLARVGLEAPDTVAAVARGLNALAERQDEDGSFPLDLTVSADRRPLLGPIGISALALLPFLAEGRRSAALPEGESDPVVARGVTWLRSELRRTEAGPGGLPESSEPMAGRGADDIALAVLALSEDYMLSYGLLAPAETAARGRELRALVDRLSTLQRTDGSFRGSTPGERPLWPLLALDAAAHTGLALGSSLVGDRLAHWLQDQPRTAEGLPSDAAGRPDATLAAAEVLSARLPAEGARLKQAATLLGATAGLDASAGTLASALALYRADPPGFGAWNRAATATLRRRLGPSGAVLRGDPVADTALTLLSLQAAYRLY